MSSGSGSNRNNELMWIHNKIRDLQNASASVQFLVLILHNKARIIHNKVIIFHDNY